MTSHQQSSISVPHKGGSCRNAGAGLFVDSCPNHVLRTAVLYKTHAQCVRPAHTYIHTCQQLWTAGRAGCKQQLSPGHAG